MTARLLCAILMAAFCTLATSPQLPAADADTPDLKRLHAAVKKLVTKYYPKSDVSLVDGKIHFEYNTRTILIHEASLRGEWQDAHEVLGPNKGGIVGDLKLEPGPYMGMAALPYTSDKRYFLHRMTAPYSKKLDAHLLIHLKYPRNPPPEFLKEFEELMEGFEKYIEQ